jgi:replicative DNA helicase
MERDVLVTIILFPDEYAIYIKALEEDYFTVDIHREIYTTLKELDNQNKKIDILLLAEKIPEVQLFIDNAPIPAANYIQDYIAELKRYKIRRDLDKLFNNAKVALKKGIDIAKIITGINRYTKNMQIDTGARDIKDIISEAMNDIEKACLSKEKKVVLSMTGIKDMTKQGEMTVIGARPGTGKTAFALKVAYDMAKQGKNVYFISREMTDVQLCKRLLAKVGRVSNYKIQNATLEQSDWDALVRAMAEISNLPIKFDSSTSFIEDIYLKIASQKNIDCLIIDYLQLLQTREKVQNRDREIGTITRTLKTMNLDIKIPIYVLSQLNRESTNEPTLKSLRESGNIEQDFDNVVFLHNTDEEQGRIRNLKLIVAKHRNGGVGKYNIFFEPDYMDFYNEWKG